MASPTQAISAPISRWENIKTSFQATAERFTVWTSRYSYDVNAKFAPNDKDGTVTKTAKVFFKYLAAALLSVFSLANHGYQTLKAKFAAPAPAPAPARADAENE